MAPRDFDRLVDQVFARIPARYRRRMDNVAIVVEPEPPRPGLLGLYHGRPLPNRSVMESFSMPDRITIYQGPHERLARSPAHLEQMVLDTVWHEIGHYFGLDEYEVQRAERRREAAFRRRRARSVPATRHPSGFQSPPRREPPKSS